jgi:hypothetical protein
MNVDFEFHKQQINRKINFLLRIYQSKIETKNESKHL